MTTTYYLFRYQYFQHIHSVYVVCHTNHATTRLLIVVVEGGGRACFCSECIEATQDRTFYRGAAFTHLGEALEVVLVLVSVVRLS